MQREKLIDLTPLLDILMIILFAVLMNVQAEKSVSEETAKEQAQVIEELSKTNRGLVREQEALEGERTKITTFLSEWVEIEDDAVRVTQPEGLREELIKYETIRDKILFVDVALQTKENKLFINDKTAYIYIPYSQVSDKAKRETLKGRIQDLIEEELSLGGGDKNFYVISLKDDGEVYRYAYQVVWEVIKDIENKYGMEKVFKIAFS